MTRRIPCKKCKIKILPITADKYDGLCKPCFDDIQFNSPEAIAERKKREKESKDFWRSAIPKLEDISHKAIELNQKIIPCPECGEILDIEIGSNRKGDPLVKNIVCQKNKCLNVHFD